MRWPVAILVCVCLCVCVCVCVCDHVRLIDCVYVCPRGSCGRVPTARAGIVQAPQVPAATPSSTQAKSKIVMIEEDSGDEEEETGPLPASGTERPGKTAGTSGTKGAQPSAPAVKAEVPQGVKAAAVQDVKGDGGKKAARIQVLSDDMGESAVQQDKAVPANKKKPLIQVLPDKPADKDKAASKGASARQSNEPPQVQGGAGAGKDKTAAATGQDDDSRVAALLAHLASLAERVTIDKLALSRLAAPMAAKCSEGEGEQATMLMRDALPRLGATLPMADRIKVLLNAQDRIGDSCLHTAVKSRQWQCAGKLVEMGACPWLRNLDGQSPIDLIKESRAKRALLPKAREQLDQFAPPPPEDSSWTSFDSRQAERLAKELIEEEERGAAKARKPKKVPERKEQERKDREAKDKDRDRDKTTAPAPSVAEPEASKPKSSGGSRQPQQNGTKGSQPSPLETDRTPMSPSARTRGGSGSGVGASLPTSPQKMGGNGPETMVGEKGVGAGGAGAGESPLGKARELKLAREALQVLDQESDEAQEAMQAAQTKVRVAQGEVEGLEEKIQALMTLKIKADLNLKKALNVQERARRDVVQVEKLWAQAVDKVTLLASGVPSLPSSPSSPGRRQGGALAAPREGAISSDTAPDVASQSTAGARKSTAAKRGGSGGGGAEGGGSGAGGAEASPAKAGEGGGRAQTVTSTRKVVIEEESDEEEGEEVCEGEGQGATGLALAGGAADADKKKKKKRKKKKKGDAEGSADAPEGFSTHAAPAATSAPGRGSQPAPASSATARPQKEQGGAAGRFKAVVIEEVSDSDEEVVPSPSSSSSSALPRVAATAPKSTAPAPADTSHVAGGVSAASDSVPVSSVKSTARPAGKGRIVEIDEVLMCA